MRERLVGLVKQLQKLLAEKEQQDEKLAAAKAKAKPKAKAKMAATAAEIELLGEIAKDVEEQMFVDDHISSNMFKSAECKKMAIKVLNEGSVPFYGCRKCRFNRKGCINYKCHPEKFLAHKMKSPELYKEDSNELSADALKGLGNKDLIGGGSKVAQVKGCMYRVYVLEFVFKCLCLFVILLALFAF